MLAEKIFINSASLSLPVNNFKRGLYTVVIETNREVTRTKFVVN
jgi:hypothetical protein